MGRAYRACVLCSGLRGIELIPQYGGVIRECVAVRGGIKLVLLSEGLRGGVNGVEGVAVVRLSGDFLNDVLTVMKELSHCLRINAYITDCSPYRAAVALTTVTILYDRVRGVSVRCESTPEGVCMANAALPHALGGRGGRRTKLLILAETASKCVTLKDLSRKLGIAPQTALRHAYTLAAAKLAEVKTLDGNPVICGKVTLQTARIIKAIIAQT